MIEPGNSQLSSRSGSNKMLRLYSMFLVGGLACIVAACSKLDFGTDPVYPPQTEKKVLIDKNPIAADTSTDSLIGDLFSVDEDSSHLIAVNGYLWRASLDTLSFMPLSSADPFGGVIITDWYAPPTTPRERFKVTAYILGRSLQSDGIRVSVFRQARTAEGDWENAVVNETLASDLENTILTRAREFKVLSTSE